MKSFVNSVFCGVAIFFLTAAMAQASALPADEDGGKTAEISEIISARLSASFFSSENPEGQKLLARIEFNAALSKASSGIKSDATAILIGIGAGAVLGAILSGGDGAAKGALLGGAVGVGYVLAKRF